MKILQMHHLSFCQKSIPRVILYFLFQNLSGYITLANFIILLKNLLEKVFIVSNLLIPIALSSSTDLTHAKINTLNSDVWARLIIENRSDLIVKRNRITLYKKINSIPSFRP